VRERHLSFPLDLFRRMVYGKSPVAEKIWDVEKLKSL
jgi:hypothetical protein